MLGFLIAKISRYNRKNIMIVGLMIWISAVLASTFVPRNSFWAFILLRSIVGIGEASYSITAPTIIADVFASVIRSRVLMLFYFAIPGLFSKLNFNCFLFKWAPDLALLWEAKLLRLLMIGVGVSE